MARVKRIGDLLNIALRILIARVRVSWRVPDVVNGRSVALIFSIALKQIRNRRFGLEEIVAELPWVVFVDFEAKLVLLGLDREHFALAEQVGEGRLADASGASDNQSLLLLNVQPAPPNRHKPLQFLHFYLSFIKSIFIFSK